jgi:hypothetical protein
MRGRFAFSRGGVAACLLCAAAAGIPGGTANAAQLDPSEIAGNPDGRPGALDPENLRKPRPAAPFDITGTWGVIFKHDEFRFLPRPKLKPAAQKIVDDTDRYAAKGIAYNGPSSLCWPMGVPEVMKLFWPIQMIQLPTAVVMISNFENTVRWVFMDGRPHIDPDLYTPSYQGDSIGHWDGDTLVIDSTDFTDKYHNIEEVPTSDQLHVIERIQMLDHGERLSVQFIMTDPVNWEGEWVNTKYYKRLHQTDFAEMHCLPDTNKGIIGTDPKYNIVLPAK